MKLMPGLLISGCGSRGKESSDNLAAARDFNDLAVGFNFANDLEATRLQFCHGDSHFSLPDDYTRKWLFFNPTSAR